MANTNDNIIGNSKDLSNEDPNVIAKRAEMDLNSYQAKAGTGKTDLASESGVDSSVETKFPGATVQTGGQGDSDKRPIQDEEGGYTNPITGHQTRAEDFQGIGGPEDQRRAEAAVRPGDQEFGENVRQGGETRRP